VQWEQRAYGSEFGAKLEAAFSRKLQIPSRVGTAAIFKGIGTVPKKRGGSGCSGSKHSRMRRVSK
jgi:hypothetical protein